MTVDLQANVERALAADEDDHSSTVAAGVLLAHLRQRGVECRLLRDGRAHFSPGDRITHQMRDELSARREAVGRLLSREARCH